MSRGDLHEALIEKAAKAIHALGCCPMDSESGGCSYPVDAYLEAKEAQAVLRAVADDIRAEALEAAATAWQTGGWADDIPTATQRTQVIVGMAQTVTRWLRARAVTYRHEGDRNA